MTFRSASAIAIFASIAIGYFGWVWTDSLNDLGGDSAVYLLSANHFLPFAAPNAAAHFFAVTSPYPPLYPILLAILGGAGSLTIAHEITAMCLLAGLVALFYWLRFEQLDTPVSLSVVALIALTPGVYMQALYLHSEMLFFAFTVSAIAALAKFELVPSRRMMLVAAAFAAAATLTRTIGIAMVAASLVWIIVNTKRDRWLAGAVAVTPLLAWTIFSPKVEPRVGYLEIFSQKLAQNLDVGLMAMVSQQATMLADGWRVNLVGEGDNAMGATIVGVIWVVALVWRLRSGRVDAYFALFYLGVLLLWPFPAERVRFMMPLVPIALAQMVLSAAQLKFSYSGRAMHAAPLAIVLVAVTGLPNLAMVYSHFTEQVPPGMESFRHSPIWYEAATSEQRIESLFTERRFVQGIRDMGAMVPKEECVFGIKPALVGLFAGRISHRTPLPQAGIADLGQCNFVYMVPFASPTYHEAFYPLHSWQGRIQLVKQFSLEPENPDSPAVGVLGIVKR